jgi:hypothetical protein
MEYITMLQARRSSYAKSYQAITTPTKAKDIEAWLNKINALSDRKYRQYLNNFPGLPTALIQSFISSKASIFEALKVLAMSPISEQQCFEALTAGQERELLADDSYDIEYIRTIQSLADSQASFTDDENDDDLSMDGNAHDSLSMDSLFADLDGDENHSSPYVFGDPNDFSSPIMSPPPSPLGDNLFKGWPSSPLSFWHTSSVEGTREHPLVAKIVAAKTQWEKPTV